MSEHDPFNEPDHRHPRARELMPEALWDCVNEAAPFGSDEGAIGYEEYRKWRADHPGVDLVECIAWILEGRLDAYSGHLLDDGAIAKVAAGDESDALAGLGYADVFTLDATIIATVLGQLVDEGRVDAAAKPFARVAVLRQSHPKLLGRYGVPGSERRELLAQTMKAIDEA